MDKPKINRPFGKFAIEPGDEALLGRLSSSHMAVLTGENYAVLASRIGVPVGTVKSRIHRARAALVELRASTMVNE